MNFDAEVLVSNDEQRCLRCLRYLYDRFDTYPPTDIDRGGEWSDTVEKKKLDGVRHPIPGLREHNYIEIRKRKHCRYARYRN
jgi:hypothetical protein